MLCKGVPIESYQAKNGIRYLIWKFNDEYYALNSDIKDRKSYADGSTTIAEVKAELDNIG